MTKIWLLVSVTLHKKSKFALKISSVNVTRFSGNCQFDHIHWKILNEKLHFLCSVVHQPKLWVAISILLNPYVGTFYENNTAQKIKFFIKDLFSKCDQIHRKLRIWSDLLEKSLMENFIFCVMWLTANSSIIHISQGRKYPSDTYLKLTEATSKNE